MPRRLIHLKKFIQISEELDDFIDRCFELGGSSKLQINDIMEMEPSSELMKECKDLYETFGEFYLFPS